MDARDLRLIYDNGIRAVIDLAINEPPAQPGRELVYCRFPLNDGDGNSNALITLAIRTIASLISCEIPTLVACSGYEPRVRIAAGSIALLTGRDPDDCLTQLITDAPTMCRQHYGRKSNGCTMLKTSRVCSATWTNKAIHASRRSAAIWNHSLLAATA